MKLPWQKKEGGGGGSSHGAPGKRKKTKKLGASVSLEKLSQRGVSGYDKRAVLEGLKQERLRKFQKLKKVKHRLEADGVLPSDDGVKFVDNVAELEREFGLGQPDCNGQAAATTSTDPVHDIKASREGRKHQKQKQQQQQLGSGGEARGVDEHQRQAGTRREPDQPQSGVAATARQQLGNHGEQQQQQQQQQQHRGGKQQQQSEGHQQLGGGDQPQNKKQKHKTSGIERVAQHVQREREARAQAMEEARKAKLERQAKLEAAEKERKKAKAGFFKKTAKGQPLMKVRMDKILHQLGISQ